MSQYPLIPQTMYGSVLESNKTVPWDKFRDERIKKLRGLINERGLDGLLLNRWENIRYITDFRRFFSIYTGAFFAALLPKNADPVLLIHAGDLQSAKLTMPWIKDIRLLPAIGRPDIYKKALDDYGIDKGRIGLDWMPFQHYEALRKAAPSATFLDEDTHIAEIRAVKLPEEIRLMYDAVKICEITVRACLDAIKPGIREYEVAAIGERAGRMEGAEYFSWEFCPISGYNAGMFIRMCTDKRMEDGDLVIVGNGIIYHGYNADVTVTTICGKPTEKQKKIYKTTYETMEAATRAIKPGVMTGDLHKMAVDIIRKAGYDEYSFRHFHPLEHGIGLNVYEPPFSPEPEKDVPSMELKAGHTLCPEPSILCYKDPSVGGVKIGNTVLVTDTGVRKLSNVLPDAHDKLMDV